MSTLTKSAMIWTVAWALILGFARPAFAAQPSYGLVVSRQTLDNPDWAQVVQVLKDKHHAWIVPYNQNLAEVEAPLRTSRPEVVCFVAPPEKLGRDVVVLIHRMLTRLDADPYTDALWGIITGYDAADALRIAQRSEPLLIATGASGAGIGHIGALKNGFGSQESTPNQFWVKKEGQLETLTVEPDPSLALAQAFNTMKPEVFYTSGHATQRDWQVLYNIKGGAFLCDNGQLCAVNSQGKRIDINSPTPKVYLPMGNCLIGDVPDQNCMVTAWIHTGGVYQMFGYTVATWYGDMGWTTKDLFNSGHYDLAEAFFFTNQMLRHRLETQYPEKARIDFTDYGHENIGKMLNEKGLFKIGDDGQPIPEKDLAGLLWDRDTVAFYGDPLWQARMPASNQPFTTEFSPGQAGRYTFTIRATAQGNWPSRPITAFLPERLANPHVTAGAEHQPVLTENFIMVPLKGPCKTGDTVQIAYRGAPFTAQPPH